MCSIAQHFFQVCARGLLAGILEFLGHPLAFGKVKMLSEIAEVLVEYQIGAPFAALLGGARVVVRAVQSHTQIHAAFHAGFAAAGVAVDGPGFTAMVAMSS